MRPPRPPRQARTRRRTGRIGAIAAAAAFVGVLLAPTAGAQECPSGAFLSYDGLAYTSIEVPEQYAEEVASGAVLGQGQLDYPTSDDGCKRDLEESDVLTAGTLDPLVAVKVEARGGELFVVGSRCAGYPDEPSRWNCLLDPLSYGGRSYSGTFAAGRGGLPAGEPLGEAELGGQPVRVLALEGVDSAVAVAVEGRDDELFLAGSACPYEGATLPSPDRSDLRLCLESPAWLVFDPPGARSGTTVGARLDRALAPELAGAEVTLVAVDSPLDAVPADRSAAVPIGSFDADAPLSFPAPDGETSFYEAVVDCTRCAERFGGRTSFALGSLLVLGQESSSGGSLSRIIAIVLGVLFLSFLVGAILVWRRGYRIGRIRRRTRR